jgi:hypothetical protein
VADLDVLEAANTRSRGTPIDTIVVGVEEGLKAQELGVCPLEGLLRKEYVRIGKAAG